MFCLKIMLLHPIALRCFLWENPSYFDTFNFGRFGRVKINCTFDGTAIEKDTLLGCISICVLIILLILLLIVFVSQKISYVLQKIVFERRRKKYNFNFLETIICFNGIQYSKLLNSNVHCKCRRKAFNYLYNFMLLLKNVSYQKLVKRRFGTFWIF